MSKKTVKPKKSSVPFYALLAVIAAVGGYALYTVTRPKAPEAIAVNPAAPPVEAEGYLYGNPDAPITIIEYADFECPGCAQFAVLDIPDIKQRIVDAGLANFRFYDFPLNIHPNAMAAHLAAACADDQGQFWRMHDRLYAGQFEWNTQATRNPRRVLAGFAQELGLDMTAWNACYDSRKHVGRIEANRNAGIARGVGGTPMLQVGNQLFRNTPSVDQLKRIVDSMAAAGATP